MTFSKNLDDYYKSAEKIQIISYIKSELKDSKRKKDFCKQFIDCMDQNIEQINISILNIFTSIIEEYLNCENPKIGKELFLKKISSFFSNPDYIVAFLYMKINLA